MIKEIYDALVAAGVPDREARKAAEAVAARVDPPGPPPESPVAAVEIRRTLAGLQAASADRLYRLRVTGSALVAVLAVSAVAIFAAYPDARLLVGLYPVHASVSLLALALLAVAQSAGFDRRERRLLAAAREDAERFEARVQQPAGPAGVDPRALLGRRAAGRGAGHGAELLYLAEAAIVGALLYALLDA